MLPRARAIEYNMWMSIMAHISEKLPLIANDFGLVDTVVDVMPAYPKDLTPFTRPSIIVQKIHTNQHRLAFGNFIGQYDDTETDTTYDVGGKEHTILYQINVNGIDNTQCSLLTSAVTEGIIDHNTYYDDQWDIELRDYSGNRSNPVVSGTIYVDSDIEVTPLSSNDNNDYINSIRVSFGVISTSMLGNSFIDLSKPIKWNAHIQL